MVKRYCDRCGQQIDEGVHAWYVLELHGTDGEFRHKEFCEECYEYLCEKDEAPKADRKTEPTCSKMEQVDEPRYEMGMGTLKCDNCSEYGSFKCSKCDGEMYFKRLEPKDKTQTERSE